VLRVRPYEDADRERWDDYVRRHAASHPGQLVGWKTVTEEQYGCPARYTLVEEEGRLRGVLPLFEKRRRGRTQALFSVPGGLLADDEDAARALLAPLADTVVREQLAFAELRDQMRAWPGLASNDEHCTLWLTLAADPDAQWRAFDAKLRNQIRKGERGGFTVRVGREHVGDFHRVQLETMRDLGTPIRGERYFRRVLECLGPCAEVLVLDLDGAPVGGMVLVEHGERAVDLWASALRRHFARCPNQVLYWAALRHAIARGLRVFDFGRSQWDSPTFHFKAQWGARPMPLHYQYLLGRATRIPTLADQRRAFDVAVRLWRRLPLPVARLMGDPIKRRFPEVM
jgi:FemAB-related protein (PEP-CTERM system-associated)